MKKLFTIFTFFILASAIVNATPSTTYWTPCTTDVQKVGTYHLGMDNYFTIFKKRGSMSTLPTDIGLTYGVFSYDGLDAEIGIDYLTGQNNPWYFNGKIGISENVFFQGAPAVNIGIFNVGTKRKVTDQNVVDLLFGKSLPDSIGGRIFAGVYRGNRALGQKKEGFMLAFDRGFLSALDTNGATYSKWVFAADYASGKNAIGGGGFGTYYYFTPNISLLTGPVWFNDQSINGKWKWTLQLDITI